MPELPEVEATRDNLARWTANTRVTAVDTDPGGPPDPGLAPLVGLRLGPWHRHGKRLAAETSGARARPGPVLLLQLGMTGRVVLDPPPDRPYQRVVLTVSSPNAPVHRVALVDLRRLGRLTLVPDLEAAFSCLGPDALDDLPLVPSTPTSPALGALLAPRAPLKQALMDQARLAGLGNIAAIESCFRARLHPRRSVATLRPDELVRLQAAIAEHLAFTLATTLGHAEIAYVSEGGDNPFLVYGRAGGPCPTCATPIERTLEAGRPTLWCPRCQPEEPPPAGSPRRR